jgi:hypothetical protein
MGPIKSVDAFQPCTIIHTDIQTRVHIQTNIHVLRRAAAGNRRRAAHAGKSGGALSGAQRDRRDHWVRAQWFCVLLLGAGSPDGRSSTALSLRYIRTATASFPSMRDGSFAWPRLPAFACCASMMVSCVFVRLCWMDGPPMPAWSSSCDNITVRGWLASCGLGRLLPQVGNADQAQHAGPDEQPHCLPQGPVDPGLPGGVVAGVSSSCRRVWGSWLVLPVVRQSSSAWWAGRPCRVCCVLSGVL